MQSPFIVLLWKKGKSGAVYSEQNNCCLTVPKSMESNIKRLVNGKKLSVALSHSRRGKDRPRNNGELDSCSMEPTPTAETLINHFMAHMAQLSFISPYFPTPFHLKWDFNTCIQPEDTCKLSKAAYKLLGNLKTYCPSTGKQVMSCLLTKINIITPGRLID